MADLEVRIAERIAQLRASLKSFEQETHCRIDELQRIEKLLAPKAPKPAAVIDPPAANKPWGGVCQ